MSKAVRELEPRVVWNFFSDLNAVPRPSKKEEQVIAFMMEFGRSLGLETSRDEIGNVLIKKGATAGKETSPVIALQSHLDMVHQKNSGTTFDFSTEGIQMKVEGDWVSAEGTTLGADNGIGVAYAMAVLKSEEIAHPAIEALFTIDEEAGMSGAKAFQGGLLDAKYLLNLDTEEDTELCIGCAGGVDVEGQGPYQQEPLTESCSTFELSLTGLSGGHSGMDIHLGLGNANKLMTRVLLDLSKSCAGQLVSIDGGGLRNAIPREAKAVLSVPNSFREQFEKQVAQLRDTLQREYATTDPNLSLSQEPVSVETKMGASPEFSLRFLRALHSLPNGIFRMSPDVPGLVQTSSNLARVILKDGSFYVACLVRGSVDSEKFDLAGAVTSALELAGAYVELIGHYPGWAPKADSGVLKVMTEIYTQLFDDAPLVNACHAGLECGILGKNYPHMEMISFGPNIRGAHSPDERVQVSSVQKSWRLLTETLARL